MMGGYHPPISLMLLMEDEQDKGYRAKRRVRTVPVERGYDTQRPRAYRPRPPARDLFPYIASGLLTAAILGLVLVIFVVSHPGPPVPSSTALQPAPTLDYTLYDLPTVALPVAEITGAPGEVPTNDIAAPPAVPTGSPPPEGDPPRMTLGELDILFNDPSARPIIIDTRPASAFEEGHIPGAILFPATDVVTNVASLPKDKLIVAYCQ